MFKGIRTLVLTAFMLCTFSVSASHIAGAYFTYKCVGLNQFEVKYHHIIRCSIGAGGFPPGTILTQNDCGHGNINIPLTFESSEILTQACPSHSTTCSGGGPEGYRLETYTATITLPAQCDSWRFTLGSCCTSFGMANQNNSQAYYYETLMNSTTEQCNSSAIPLNPGAPNYYAFEQVVHDFNFVDPDAKEQDITIYD